MHGMASSARGGLVRPWRPPEVIQVEGDIGIEKFASRQEWPLAKVLAVLGSAMRPMARVTG